MKMMGAAVGRGSNSTGTAGVVEMAMDDDDDCDDKVI
jgi:hypothetical protein